MSGLLLGCLFVLLSVGAATAATSNNQVSAAGKISAHLTKTSFTSSQASSVKLIYTFSAASKSFGYVLTFRAGSKWQPVKSLSRKGSFAGSKSMTVKQVFAGKPVKVGSYRLKLAADGGSKLLSFVVVKATSNTWVPKLGHWQGTGISFWVSGNQVEDIEIAVSGDTDGCTLVQSISDTFSSFPNTSTGANDQFSAQGSISHAQSVDIGNVSGTFHTATSASGSMNIDYWWPTCIVPTNGAYMGANIELGPVNWSATWKGSA